MWKKILKFFLFRAANFIISAKFFRILNTFFLSFKEFIWIFLPQKIYDQRCLSKKNIIKTFLINCKHKEIFFHLLSTREKNLMIFFFKNCLPFFLFWKEFLGKKMKISGFFLTFDKKDQTFFLTKMISSKRHEALIFWSLSREKELISEIYRKNLDLAICILC